MHEEMPEMRQGLLSGFQLWVNLPARLKMTSPRYQEIVSTQIPEIARPEGVKIRVVAGTVDGVHGPVTEIFADPTYLDVSIEPQSSFVQPIERGHTAFAYVFEGQGLFGVDDQEGGEFVSSPKLVILGDGDYVAVQTAEQAVRFLLISGAPLNEPIARYGPFVMNTSEEIQQALRDLRNGTFVMTPQADD